MQLASRFDAFKQKCSGCYSWHSHIGKLIICRSFLRFLVGDNGQISRARYSVRLPKSTRPHGSTGRRLLFTESSAMLCIPAKLQVQKQLASPCGRDKMPSKKEDFGWDCFINFS